MTEPKPVPAGTQPPRPERSITMIEPKKAPEGANPAMKQVNGVIDRLRTEQAHLLLDWNLTAKTETEIEQARKNIETLAKLFQF